MQGYFELINIPYSTCDVLMSALTFDKFVLNRYLKSYGIRVPESILLRIGDEYDEKEIEAKIGLPCFITPATDGSSFGVSKGKNADQIAPALRKAFMESSEVMVEGFLDGIEKRKVSIKRRKNRFHSPSQKWLQATSSSITTPNTMAK